jgi:hypothetical protein
MALTSFHVAVCVGSPSVASSGSIVRLAGLSLSDFCTERAGTDRVREDPDQDGANFPDCLLVELVCSNCIGQDVRHDA